MGGDTDLTSAEGSSKIQVDFVLVFDVSVDAKQPAESAKDCERQHDALLERLSETQLLTTSRPGAADADELLIFVKCPEDKVRSEATLERISDYLHSVGSAQADPLAQRDYDLEPLTPSERTRLAYRTITGRREPTRKARSPAAGITAGRAPFTRVKSIFAPHDTDFNNEWISRWTSQIIAFRPQEVELVRNANGEAIALYFEFLRCYFLSLSIPAAFGFIAWAVNAHFSIAYAIALAIWSVVFVEAWSIRERQLAVRWGCLHCDRSAPRLASFTPDGKAYDGQPEYTWWKRDSRILTSLPALLLFAAVLACLLSLIYTTEVFIEEAYTGPGKAVLSYLPTVLYAGLVPQVVSVWEALANRFTLWENHEVKNVYDKSLGLKIFTLNAVVSFGGLFLTAYVYTPFGSLIIPRLKEFIATHVARAADIASKRDKFIINGDRLHSLIITLLTTEQLTDAATELGLPLVYQHVLPRLKGFVPAFLKKRKEDQEVAQSDLSEEVQFLQKIRYEATLEEYKVFTDYAEMAVQFGYVTLWSVIWPLAPLMAFLNNFFELRRDAFKMTSHVRRPTPQRTDSIGPWLATFSFLTWMGIITNSSLIYLYRPQYVSLHASAHEALNEGGSNIQSSVEDSTDQNDQETFKTIRSALFTALLVALASEHAYVLARVAVRHVLDRALWRGTEEQVALQKNQETVKNRIVEDLNLEVHQPSTETLEAVKQKMQDRHGGTSVNDRFWTRPQVGLEGVREQTKRE